MKKFATVLMFLFIGNLFVIPKVNGQIPASTVFSTKQKPIFYKVKKVVDGDTFWIEDGTSKGKKVRFIGIDAPESRRTGKKDIGYYGAESKNYLTKRMMGKSVRLEKDISTVDRFKRILAYVYLEDGTFLNAEMISNGYAVVYTYPPDVRYASYFLKLQKNARAKRRGLWAPRPK